MTNIDPQIVINILNEIVKIDKQAIQKLIEYRVPCDPKLAEHPSIMVKVDEKGENPQIGLLGILNGIVGSHPSGYGYISARYSDVEDFEDFAVPPQVKNEE